MVFEGYLSFGGNEIVNNARVRGYGETADCKIAAFVADPCDSLGDALGDTRGQSDAYTWPRNSLSPWYDPRAPEQSSQFYGIYGLSITEVQNAVRSVAMTQGVQDGGVIGRTRKGMKALRARGMMIANGMAAMEHGWTWLSNALDADACGTVSESCGVADVEFMAACPPERPSEPVYDDWQTLRTNLATNPSFETTSATLEYRRNFATNPMPASVTGYTGANGATTSYVTSPRQAIEVACPVSATTDVGLTLGSRSDWVADETWHVSFDMEAVTAGTYRFVTTGSGVTFVTNHDGTNGSWTFAAGQQRRLLIRLTVTAQATGSLYIVRTDTAVAQTFRVSKLLIERTSVPGTDVFPRAYFDGSTQPAVRENLFPNPSFASGSPSYNGSWSGTGNTTTVSTQPLASAASGRGLCYAYSAVGNANSGDFGLTTDSSWLATGTKYTIVYTVTRTGSTGSLAAPGYGGSTGAASTTIHARSVADNTTLVDGIGQRRWITFTLSALGQRIASQAVFDLTYNTSFYISDVVCYPGDYDAAKSEPLYIGMSAPQGYGVAWRGTANASTSYMYDADFTPAWSGTANASASILTAPIPANTTTLNSASRCISTHWSSDGARSIRGIPVGGSLAAEGWLHIAGSTSGLSGLGVTFTPGRTYTVLAKSWIEEVQTTTSSSARRLQAIWNNVSGWTGTTSAATTAAPNTPGVVTDHRLVFTVPADAVWFAIRAGCGGGMGSPGTWWDDFLVIEGDYQDDYFDGDTLVTWQDPDTNRYAWTGTPDASTSQFQTRTRTMVPVDDGVYDDLVDDYRRYLLRSAVTSGPILIGDRQVGDLLYREVEFTFTSEMSMVTGKPKELAIQLTDSIVTQDELFNLVPMPSAEVAGTAVVAMTNYATNPSAETGTSGYLTTASGGPSGNGTMVLSNPTGVASVGSRALCCTFTATASSSTSGYFAAYQTVALPTTTGMRFSLSMWAALLLSSGAASLGTITIDAHWRATAGGTATRVDTLGTVPANGGSVSVASILPPAGTVEVAFRAYGTLNSFFSGAVVNLYIDAVSVTNP